MLSQTANACGVTALLTYRLLLAYRGTILLNLVPFYTCQYHAIEYLQLHTLPGTILKELYCLKTDFGQTKNNSSVSQQIKLIIQAISKTYSY